MRALAIAGLTLCPGCLTYKYERHATFEPVVDSHVAELVVGTSDIGDTLARLGAPLYVWEGADDAVVLAYGYENQRGWGFSVSVPVAEQLSASFDYDDLARKLEGYILVFDRDLQLKIVRAGLLRDLSKSVRLRPATVE